MCKYIIFSIKTTSSVCFFHLIIAELCKRIVETQCGVSTGIPPSLLHRNGYCFASDHYNE